MNNKPLRQIIEEVMTVKAQWSLRDFVEAIEILQLDEAPKDPAKPLWRTASTTSVAVFNYQCGRLLPTNPVRVGQGQEGDEEPDAGRRPVRDDGRT